MQKPSAIWAAGLELADLLDDAGNIDPGKAQTAVHTAAEELGLMNRPRTPQPHPAQQSGMSGIPGITGADRFADVIAGRDR
ncbi:hypothetical protein [Enteractinococcus helveticum]|uniref:Uncharacterized protein n=1 Tax=Enteractinococcus helveticum TaxID=1837282 RepID=A0A1B7M3I0_9MICC|nr:hypothetical protein [Enteractinococcus helveticum]OAV63125.1 hypothetical protein A6F49_02940 [Enteractinococcus helveticum]